MLQRGTLLPSDISHLATSSRPSGVGGKAERVCREEARPRGMLGNVVQQVYHVQLGQMWQETEKHYNYQNEDTDGWTKIKKAGE